MGHRVEVPVHEKSGLVPEHADRTVFREMKGREDKNFLPLFFGVIGKSPILVIVFFLLSNNLNNNLNLKTTKMKKEPETIRIVLHEKKSDNNTIWFEVYMFNAFVCYAFINAKYDYHRGAFDADLVYSSKFNYFVILLRMPGHSGIEFHGANYSQQLKGCIAPCMELASYGGIKSLYALQSIKIRIGQFDAIIVEFIRKEPLIDLV